MVCPNWVGAPTSGTIEVTQTVTADMLAKQHAAVDRTQRAADAKHARELALNNKRLYRNFEAEAAQLRTKHGKEIAAVEARLAAEQDTGAELQVRACACVRASCG